MYTQNSTVLTLALDRKNSQFYDSDEKFLQFKSLISNDFSENALQTEKNIIITNEQSNRVNQNMSTRKTSKLYTHSYRIRKIVQFIKNFELFVICHD